MADPAGERDLDRLLASMSPVVRPGSYVFVSGPAPIDGAVATVVEDEGVTSVVPQSVADEH